jgi:hypothetical protein
MGGALKAKENTKANKAVAATGSSIAQKYPPGERPYVVAISRKINAEIALIVLKRADGNAGNTLATLNSFVYLLKDGVYV